MFQDFTATTTPATGADRVARLREAMKAEGVDGFLIPRADAHQGENVAPRDERLAWLTSFTGSAGFCAVLAENAGLFVDGRYTLQVAAQTDGAVFDYLPIPATKLSDWLVEHLQSGQVFAYDPWLHGFSQISELSKALEDAGISLRPVENLVDRIWEDQPPPPNGAIIPYPAEMAGEDSASKRARIGNAVVEAGAATAVLTLPDSIAWLLNIRGEDIVRMPVTLAFACLRADGKVHLFVDPSRMTDALVAHLGPDVTLEAPGAFSDHLAGLEGPVLLDKTTAPIRVHQILDAKGTDVIWQRDPCILPKACKNAAELAGSREAHLRDAGAMAEFLCWLDETAPKGGLTEIDVVRELEGRRRATNALRDISFETISGAGPNGAIVHYRVTEETNRAVVPGQLLLVDSGGQYLDGTTDITRTMAVGDVDPAAARAFTLVLKGMIAMSLARWPEGLAGRDLDALARAALWRAGLDYDHGTGHGVGVYLGVHEGPQGLSRRSVEPLLPGMIVSNEPGYYREGAFGIRIENLCVVTAPEVPEGGERPMLGFETLTFAPIDRNLILPELLDGMEKDWLNAYHSLVLSRVGPIVSLATRAWLERACAPI